MNACVRESIRHALLKVYSRFERDFSKLVDALSISGTSTSSSGHPPQDTFYVYYYAVAGGQRHCKSHIFHQKRGMLTAALEQGIPFPFPHFVHGLDLVN